MKAAIRIPAPISETRTSGLDQPAGLPRIRPKISPKSASEKVTRPAQSIGTGSDAATFASRVSVRKIAAIPIGTLTKKIHSHPRVSVITPPTSGPMATAPPTVAPQTPIALARSLPSNSCAISASEVANIAAPPTPWRARKKLSTVGSFESPHNSEARVKTPNPIEKIRLRPSRSPSDPNTSRNEARVSAYASTTH